MSASLAFGKAQARLKAGHCGGEVGKGEGEEGRGRSMPAKGSCPSRKNGTCDLMGGGGGEEVELHLYRVKNDTGVLLRYDGQSNNVWYEVPAGAQEPLLLPPSKERAKQQQQGGQGLQLELQRPGQMAWSKLVGVNVEEEGMRLHSIHTLDGVLWVVCEVSRVAGVKLLRVRSTEMFENKCSMSLHVVLKAGYGVVQWEKRLAPGAQ
eukprot:evm.model.NODE_35198_length_9878_cov_24.301985.4